MLKTSIIYDFLHLLYPMLCAACQKEALDANELFCIHCEHQLAQTTFHQIEENECTDRLEGRFPFQTACAMFRFHPRGLVQSMIHKIKYQQQPEIAFRLGRRYGKILATSPHYKETDLIIPVPLHKKKKRKRGFNQSTYFAKGLATSMAARIDDTSLRRVKNTDTQTKKSKLERLENLDGAFVVQNPNRIKRKNLLLVDDVLTTGATLEFCSLELLKHHPSSLCIATIALAE